MTDAELLQMKADMRQAEQEGFFEGMYQPVEPLKSEQPPASKERLLAGIRPDMKLTRGFFLKVYGYGLYDKGFLNQALQKLASVGCTRAYDYYISISGEYEQEQDTIQKNVSEWYGGAWEQLYRNYIQTGEVMEECRKNEAPVIAVDLHRMSDKELLDLLQNLNKRNHL